MLGGQFLYLRHFTQLQFRYLSSLLQYDISFVCLSSSMQEGVFVHLKFRRYVKVLQSMDYHWAGVFPPTLRTLKGQFNEFACFKASASFLVIYIYILYRIHLSFMINCWSNSELLKLSPDFIFAKNSKGILLYQVIQI